MILDDDNPPTGRRVTAIVDRPRPQTTARGRFVRRHGRTAFAVIDLDLDGRRGVTRRTLVHLRFVQLDGWTFQ